MVDTKFSCAEDILCGINTPKDKGNLTDLEKKHLPIVEAPAKVKRDDVFEVRVEVGKLLTHPNEPAHFIEWIELYAGDSFLGRAHLSAGASFPTAVFKVRLSHAEGPLKIREKCNLHGIWETVQAITIE